MPDGTVDNNTSKERRRRWSVEEKLRIVAEVEEPGAGITEVAARHEVYPSLLFNWRAGKYAKVSWAPGICRSSFQST